VLITTLLLLYGDIKKAINTYRLPLLCSFVLG
jgi:hypothetical protein